MMLATVLDDVSTSQIPPLICGDMELDLALLYSFLQLGMLYERIFSSVRVSGEHLGDISSSPVVAA